jgi:hypothetical protein
MQGTVLGADAFYYKSLMLMERVVIKIMLILGIVQSIKELQEIRL